MRREINRYKIMYSNYSNYFENFNINAQTSNNHTFVKEFIKQINNCEDLFVLYLFYIMLEK